MEILDNLNHYKIVFSHESVLIGNLKRVQVTFKLINGRFTTLKVTINRGLKKVLYIVAPKNLLKDDVQEIGLQEWIVEHYTGLQDRLVKPVLQYFIEGEWTLLCCFPYGDLSSARTQIRNMTEEIQNVPLKPDLAIYGDMSFLFKNDPTNVAQIEFYTFNEFISYNELTNETDNGTHYAQFYRRLRTISQVAIAHKVSPTFVRKNGQPLFFEKEHFIERVQISKRTYLGSEFDNKNVILCSFHSHDVHQTQHADVVLYSIISDGYMFEQYMVYLNPEITYIPIAEVNADLIDHFTTMLDLQKYEIRLSFKTNSFQASRETGTYLLPQISNQSGGEVL
ncbi:hypothetical protein HP548_02830 [Paenibacillus taichungensis]|uniref:DUF3822 family protein n=1 Tax=Paenibacillus taichungensis TaxID=484184 RepID=A0ABX2MDL2_9BACL|nr:hypothetical protein [Paenibacillus taichungensis]NUU53031.1 hypothetical protein [Paenibacillus taichungensis]